MRVQQSVHFHNKRFYVNRDPDLLMFVGVRPKDKRSTLPTLMSIIGRMQKANGYRVARCVGPAYV